MKIKLIVLLLLVTGITKAYDLKIFNKTDGILEVRISYSAQGVCAFRDYVIEADKNKTVPTSPSCCPDSIWIRSITGTAVKAFKNPRKWKHFFEGENKIWLKHVAPRTLGSACKNFDVTIKNLASGELIAENSID